MSSKKTTPKNVKKQPLFTKKRILLIVTALIAVALALYTWLSFSYWRNYSRRAQGLKDSSSLLAKDIGSLESSFEEIIKAAKDLQKDAKDIKGCESSWLVSWQKVFGTVKDKVTSCQEISQPHHSAQAPLSKLINFADQQQKLSTIINSALPGGQIKVADLEKILKTLEDSEKDIAALAKANPEDQIVKSAATVLKSYKEAASGLAAANEKEDMTAFEKAADDLAKAYKELEKLPKLEKSHYQKLLQAVLDQLKPLS